MTKLMKGMAMTGIVLCITVYYIGATIGLIDLSNWLWGAESIFRVAR